MCVYLAAHVVKTLKYGSGQRWWRRLCLFLSWTVIPPSDADMLKKKKRTNKCQRYTNAPKIRPSYMKTCANNECLQRLFSSLSYSHISTKETVLLPGQCEALGLSTNLLCRHNQLYKWNELKERLCVMMTMWSIPAWRQLVWGNRNCVPVHVWNVSGVQSSKASCTCGEAGEKHSYLLSLLLFNDCG